MRRAGGVTLDPVDAVRGMSARRERETTRRQALMV